MSKLDEAGLAAATREAASRRLGYPTQGGVSSVDEVDIAAVITAYLDVAQTRLNLQRLGQECEGDRFAVVVAAEGAVGAMGNCGVMAEENWREMEEALERNLGATGPFRRQIVTVPGGLLRAEPVGEIFGITEPA